MKQFWHNLLTNRLLFLVTIFLVAFALRFYHINEIPYGFYWDEAAITYNAWGISVWNRDEFGNKLPISFKSFGDYKAPLLIYTLAAIYKIVGLQPELLRILIALFGVASVGLMYVIALELEYIYKLSKNFKYVVAFVMAILPWAVQFSRIGVEAMLALMLILAGFYFVLKTRQKTLYWLPAGIAFGLSLYAYHSSKIFVPIFLMSLLLLKKTLNFRWKPIITTAFIFLIVSWPLVYDSVSGQGFERGKTMIIFADGKLAPVTNITTQLSKNITSYVTPQFWFFGQDAIGLRHSVPGHGVAYYAVGLMFFAGIVFTIRRSQFAFFLVAWFLAGLLPSVLTYDAPHAIRSMLALPPLVLLASMGLVKVFNYSKWLGLAIGAIMCIETGWYLYAYYGFYADQSAQAFQYGYKQAILYAESIGKDAEKIIVTDTYGQPYIYTLLYRKLTPEEFKFGALANYEFHSIKWPDDRPDRVYVATPKEIPPNDPSVVKIISIPTTSTPVFVIAKK